MATYPFKIANCGPFNAKKIFKVKFSQPLSSVPELRCYDNSQTYPNTGELTTSSYIVFAGSTANGNKPMLMMVDTTRVSPGVTSWYTQATIGAGVATCMMKGDTSYLKFRYSSASMVANASLTWNALMKVPHDVNPTMTRQHDVTVRYTYTSTIPNVEFFANNQHAGGNDSVAVWGTITPDSQGVRFGSSTATNTSILANIPLAVLASWEVTYSGWVTVT